jgi:hypothetical protein
MSYIVKPEKQSLIGSLIFSDYHSVEWQKTLAEIHKITYEKLMKEVKALERSEDKLLLLEKSRLLPIFNEHQANHIITGAFGRTDVVIRIDEAMELIKSRKMENH